MDPTRNRDRLLAGAVDWTLAHGVAALTLRPLAKALGTSDRMLVYHFGSKDGLVDTVLATANERLLAGLDPEPLTADGTVPALVSGLWSQLSSAEAEPYLRLYFEAYGLALQQPERYRPYLVHTVRGWHTLAVDLLRACGVPEEQTLRRATLIVSAIDGLLLDLYATGDRARIDQAASDLATHLGT
jgi:AcrR family transcriptional regulator